MREAKKKQIASFYQYKISRFAHSNYKMLLNSTEEAIEKSILIAKLKYE